MSFVCECSFQHLLLVPSARLFQLLEQGEDYFKLSLDLTNEIDHNAYCCYLYLCNLVLVNRTRRRLKFIAGLCKPL